jgi:hypothetical protein
MQMFIDILGFTVRDKVTGFVGIATSIGFDLYGCIQVVVHPPVDDKKPTEIADGRWFDFHRLEVTSKDRVMPLPSFAGVPASNRSYRDKSRLSGPADKPVR